MHPSQVPVLLLPYNPCCGDWGASVRGASDNDGGARAEADPETAAAAENSLFIKICNYGTKKARVECGMNIWGRSLEMHS